MQEDLATCHTAKKTIDFLQTRFGHKFISRNGPVKCPSRCCDLPPLDYFLRSCLNLLVYANEPAAMEALEAKLLV